MDRMKMGMAWESYLHQYLDSLPMCQVEQFGQTLLGPLARKALHKKETSIRWLPDYLLKIGTEFVWVEAKMSAAVIRTGNHSCEDSSTATLKQLSDETGHAAIYAFWHENNVPKFMSMDTYLAHREPRNWLGSGSATPFHIVPCRYCQPDIASALHIKEGAA